MLAHETRYDVCGNRTVMLSSAAHEAGDVVGSSDGRTCRGTAGAVACLKITLDDVKLAVLRRIEVPLNIRLDRLHLAIQAAMGCPHPAASK
jgi:hypothetical protein